MVLESWPSIAIFRSRLAVTNVRLRLITGLINPSNLTGATILCGLATATVEGRTTSAQSRQPFLSGNQSHGIAASHGSPPQQRPPTRFGDHAPASLTGTQQIEPPGVSQRLIGFSQP